MKIKVKVISNSSQQKVVQITDSNYKIYIRAFPIKGEANKKVRALLVAYFNLPKHQVVLISGKTAQIKIFEIR